MLAVIFSNASLSSIFLIVFWVSLFIFQAFLMQKLSFVGRYFRDVALLHQRCLKTMEHDVVNKLKPCGCHIRWCYVYVCNHRWLMAILLFARLTWGRLHMGGGPTWLFNLCWREFVWSASSVRFVELFFVLSDREHPKRFVRVEPTSYRQHCEPVEPTLCQQQPHAAQSAKTIYIN